MTRTALLSGCVSLLVLSGCAAEQGVWVSKYSLYYRLGQRPQIEKVVDAAFERARADTELNFTRRGTPKPWDDRPENVARLKERLTQYLCVATGGPEIYEGARLPDTHAGMQITTEEVDRFAADFRDALEALHVPAPETQELLKILADTGHAFVNAGATPAREGEAPAEPK